MLFWDLKRIFGTFQWRNRQDRPSEQRDVHGGFHNGLKLGHFNESLEQKVTSMMEEIMTMVECYTKLKESNVEKRTKVVKERSSKPKSSEHKKN